MKKRRAVSEIVASLILLMIVSGLGTVLYGFTLDVSQNQREKMLTNYQDSSDGLLEKVTIIDVWYDQSVDKLNITVLNFGEIETSIETVYVNGNQVSSIESGLDNDILVQKLGEIVFTSPINLSPDEEIEVVIVSKRGNSYEATWKI